MVSHLDDTDPKTRESRGAQRRRMLKQVQVLSLDKKSASAIDCTLRNLSTSGAMLSGPGASISRIPNQFYLVTPGQLRMIRCKIVWKNYDSVGVCFLSDPGHLASEHASSTHDAPNGTGGGQLPKFSRTPEEQGSASASESIQNSDLLKPGELPALLDSQILEVASGEEPQLCLLALEHLSPGQNTLRESLDQEELNGLAQSVRENGLLQPLIVRRSAGERYEIVAGERRWRAAQIAGLNEVPVLIANITDGEALQIALIENVQRADLDPLEEAKGYHQLIERFGYTQQHVAVLVGKSRSHVANALRLMRLPDQVQAHLKSGKLTAGHLRALVSINAPAELAQQIIDLDLNVRETERLVNAQERSRAHHPKMMDEKKDSKFHDLEQAISDHLSLKVEIASRTGSGGRIVVHFRTPEQFNGIYQLLMMRQA